MADLLVRNVDQRVVDSLKRKAELRGTSLNEVARAALDAGAPLTPEERVALSKELRKLTRGGPLQPLTRDELREGLE
jgi:plasmid stability protein